MIKITELGPRLSRDHCPQYCITLTERDTDQIFVKYEDEKCGVLEFLSKIDLMSYQNIFISCGIKIE